MPEVFDSQMLDHLVEECQLALRYRFRDPQLLIHCLTHASAARSRIWSNERLEFLGDAILGTIVCEALYHRFPDAAEGEMTRVKSIVVSRVTCAALASRLELQRFILTGKGLGGSGGRIPMSILAGTFESLVAGLYLDGGLDAARSFLIPLVMPEIEDASASLHAQNYKSLLQHIAQKTQGATPIYRLLEECGPDHSKRFHVQAVIAGREFPSAWGVNKKEAEQLAAQNAIQELVVAAPAELPPALPAGAAEEAAVPDVEMPAEEFGAMTTDSTTSDGATESISDQPPDEEFGVFLDDPTSPA